MTQTERLSAALTTLRWGPNDVAVLCDINERTVRRWLTDTHRIPLDVLDWLERLAAYHGTHEAPRRQ